MLVVMVIGYAGSEGDWLGSVPGAYVVARVNGRLDATD